MNKSEKYSEIILLGQMLQERKIEHEQHDLYDGYQIIVPLPEPTKEISVIEHQCSYGSIMNLLEYGPMDRFKDTCRQSRR